jgi:thioredoxin-related protein
MAMKQTVMWLFGWLAILAWGASPARADVPWASDLKHDAEMARARNGVVLLVFVGDSCRFCEVALREFLIPMSGHADYQSKVIMRRIEARATRELRDFQGNLTSHGQFALLNKARFTPTVQVFGPDGQRLGKPVVGLLTRDYYGAYLDQVIDEWVAMVRARLATPG